MLQTSKPLPIHVINSPVDIVIVSLVYVIHAGIINPTKYRKVPTKQIAKATERVRVLKTLKASAAIILDQ